MRAPLPAELAHLFERLHACRGDPLEIGADETAEWSPGLAALLVRQRVMMPVAPATSMTCPGCEEACWMPVHERAIEGREAVAFIACDKRDDMGRVPVPLGLLYRWHVTWRSVGEALARSLDRPGPAVLAEALRLGWIDSPDGLMTVHLQARPDAVCLLVAGRAMELPELLMWQDGVLGLDRRALVRRARAPAAETAGSAEKPEDRAKRLRARKAELRARNVKGFLQEIAKEEGISVQRVKQIVGKTARADPFDGLGSAGSGPAPSSTRRKPPR